MNLRNIYISLYLNIPDTISLNNTILADEQCSKKFKSNEFNLEDVKNIRNTLEEQKNEIEQYKSDSVTELSHKVNMLENNLKKCFSLFKSSQFLKVFNRRTVLNALMLQKSSEEKDSSVFKNDEADFKREIDNIKQSYLSKLSEIFLNRSKIDSSKILKFQKDISGLVELIDQYIKVEEDEINTKNKEKVVRLQIKTNFDNEENITNDEILCYIYRSDKELLDKFRSNIKVMLNTIHKFLINDKYDPKDLIYLVKLLKKHEYLICLRPHLAEEGNKSTERLLNILHENKKYKIEPPKGLNGIDKIFTTFNHLIYGLFIHLSYRKKELLHIYFAKILDEYEKLAEKIKKEKIEKKEDTEKVCEDKNDRYMFIARYNTSEKLKEAYLKLKDNFKEKELYHFRFILDISERFQSLKRELGKYFGLI